MYRRLSTICCLLVVLLLAGGTQAGEPVLRRVSRLFRPAPAAAPVHPLAGAPCPYPYGYFGATYAPYGYAHRGYYGDASLVGHHPAR